MSWFQLGHIRTSLLTSATSMLINTTGLTQIAKFMGPPWGPPGSCRPQMGPHVGPMNLAIGECTSTQVSHCILYSIAILSFIVNCWTLRYPSFALRVEHVLCLGQWSCFYARCAKFSWYGKMSRGSTLWPRNIQQMGRSGPCFNMKTIFYSYRIPINKLLWSHGGIKGHSGPCFNIKTILFRYKIPIIKIISKMRQSHWRLIPI